MIRKPIHARSKIFLGFLSVIVVLVVYTVISHRQHHINPLDTSIPTWHQIKDGLIKACTTQPRNDSPWILDDTKASAVRYFSGLFIGIVGSVILGMAMGCYKKIEAFMLPILSVFAKIPPTAMLAVFFVVAGTGYQMFLAMIAFGILPTMAQSIYLAVKDVPKETIDKSYTLGASNIEIIFHVIFPYVLPATIDAIRLQLGPALVYLIAAEMVVADVGYGFRIRLQSRLINMDVVFVYLAFLAAFGYAMDYFMIGVQKFMCPWSARNKS
jgi:ABC-type nitrate/sulfonate/bicarbonate transport system permease component